jgi:hypothetical protein
VAGSSSARSEERSRDLLAVLIHKVTGRVLAAWWYYQNVGGTDPAALDELHREMEALGELHRLSAPRR